MTGVLKDGDMLVLRSGRGARPGMRENDAPVWVVISLTLDGDLMNVAQMLERSVTTHRGSGTKQG